ncbi:hypothetical protein [Bacillus mojavensis]|uniref:hypothetical protein n=1 Tax=Bacillus mojavensis TaxID=72360 RepID=UPI002DBE1989|nr:hypothetical protein [Bacillus mojavensis]MEC1621109.1 hypothetical protein [Bacillus mojavensis]
MRKPKTARLKKEKGFNREITLQEAFDVIAEELFRIGKAECAFIGYERGKTSFSAKKIDLHVMEGGKEFTVIKSSKTISELERGI